MSTSLFSYFSYKHIIVLYQKHKTVSNKLLTISYQPPQCLRAVYSSVRLRLFLRSSISKGCNEKSSLSPTFGLRIVMKQQEKQKMIKEKKKRNGIRCYSLVFQCNYSVPFSFSSDKQVVVNNGDSVVYCYDEHCVSVLTVGGVDKEQEDEIAIFLFYFSLLFSCSSTTWFRLKEERKTSFAIDAPINMGVYGRV